MAGVRVLIVDDDGEFCRMLMTVLGKAGYQTAYATSIGEAQKLAEEFHPQAALLDLRLPDGTGTDLLGDLKERHPDCICIVMTGHTDLDSVLLALERGAFQYLQKPFNQGVLLSVIGRAAELLRLREIKLAKEMDESANRAKSDFLANMSHELRTPLFGIMGMVSMLLDTEPSDQQEQYLYTMQNSAEALLTIINDLLDVSKIETGRLTINSAPFDLTQILDAVVELLSPRALEKNIRLVTNLDPQTPRQLEGDAGRIRQVLINLLDNALKFTPAQGKVTIRIGCEEQAAGKARIRFAVEDTGIGVAEEELSRIFDKFTQVDMSPSRSFTGTGLGLAISRQLVELMGGSMQVDSRLGEGSSFAFALELVLPADAEPQLPPPAAKTQALGIPQFALKVLVVEDNVVSQEVACTILEKLGCTVTLAIDGWQAVRLCESKSFDLVLMDCQMPGLDGFEATAMIRRQEQDDPATKIRIVAVTAHALAEDRQRCLDAGMDDYLAKPATLNDFRDALDRACTALGRA